MAYGKTKFFLLFIFWFSLSDVSQAQIVPDNTLPKNSVVNSNCTASCEIKGGTIKKSNLFHSFDRFSVPTNGEAVFNNSPQIENIFTRVTGSSISNIDGAIRAQGSANLFLINPNGIIFGNNARLDIGGSFLATTADSILFADDSQFSATNPQESLLLTISVPIGLQFGKTPGEIVNRSQVEETIKPSLPPIDVGLKVDNGKTLALVGSEIELDGGFLTAFEGRIELGSVAPNSFVGLTQNAEDLIASYDSVNQFDQISIINNSQLSTSTVTNSKIPSGNIKIYGSLLEVKNSYISSSNSSDLDGGKIVINAETFNLQNTEINTITSGKGGAGDIEVNAKLIKLIRDNENKNLEVGLISYTEKSLGKAGNITINTNQLTIQNGARVVVSTFGSGKGGDLTVNASEIEVIGIASDDKDASALSAESKGSEATGDAGNLTVNTGRLIVRDGGKISVGANESFNSSRLGISQGNGGNLEINATESVEVNGFGFNGQGNNIPSTLLSESQGIGNAGNLDIITPKLTVTNDAEINVNATGTGEAGSLNIKAQEVNLDNGSLTAVTRRGDEGNIILSNLDTLLLRNNSQINTDASESATGGDITISSEAIALLNGSDITAKADAGKGGNITITTEGIFKTPNSEIDASSRQSIDGTITINNPDVDPTSGIIKLPGVSIDAEAILADNLCKFEDDKIAEGSSFIITGRGGLTPTSADSLDNVDNVVRWANKDNMKVSQNGLVGVRQRPENEGLENNSPTVQQSKGWVTTIDGSVWLVANSPEIMPQNSRMVNPDCKALR